MYPSILLIAKLEKKLGNTMSESLGKPLKMNGNCANTLGVPLLGIVKPPELCVSM